MKRRLVWASEDEPSEAASMSEKNKHLGKRWETSLEHSECSHPGACSRKCESWFACKQTLALVQNRRRVNWTKWRCGILPSFPPQSNRFHPGVNAPQSKNHSATFQIFHHWNMNSVQFQQTGGVHQVMRFQFGNKDGWGEGISQVTQ